MSRIDKKSQRELRQFLTALGAGQAERERDEDFGPRFHPVLEHIRALDRDVVLVVGERGAGKSALFSAIFQHGLLPALERHAPNVRLPGGTPNWIPHSIHRDFPDAEGLRSCLFVEGPERGIKLWFAYLVRALKEHLEEGATESLRRIWACSGSDPERVLEAFEAAQREPLIALEHLDEELERENRWIFVGYDELDTLGLYDWQVMQRSLEGLIGFWAAYSRRWRRIRAKLFLRTDLFRRHARFGGADLPKLATNRVDLVWSDRNLHAMLLKRIANSDSQLLDYCRSSKIQFTEEDPDLGYIPKLDSAEKARPFIERLVGQFMGASSSKGRTFTWILDHLRDAHDHVIPRNLVRLIEYAALKEQANQKARSPQLLHPTALRQALEDVSKDYILQGVSEWPWLEGVRERLRGQLMPMPIRQLRDSFAATWEDSWGIASASSRPPVSDPGAMVDYLLELGVLRRRTGDRIDVPDIYLYGLQLRRKGGVRRG